MTIYKSLFLAAALVAGLAPNLGAARQPAVASADLTLAQPASQKDFVIDGAAWNCTGTTCHSAFVDDMPALRSCKRIVSETGAVTAFTYRGKVLSEDEIRVCNTRAKA